MTRFPEVVTLRKDEALDVLAALEASARVLVQAGVFAAGLQAHEAAELLWDKLTQDWPDESA